LCILTGLLVIQQRTLLRSIQKWAIRKRDRKLSRSIYFFIKILGSFRSCFTLPALLFGIILGIVAWGAEGAAFYYILRLLDIDMPAQSAIFIYAFSMLIGAITFLPGGLGGAEMTMLQLLLWYHAPAAEAAAATIVIRLATLWFSVALGLLMLPFLQKKRYSSNL
jgi:uncharacterized protein (TIRG00374 family)